MLTGPVSWEERGTEQLILPGKGSRVREDYTGGLQDWPT